MIILVSLGARFGLDIDSGDGKTMYSLDVLFEHSSFPYAFVGSPAKMLSKAH